MSMQPGHSVFIARLPFGIQAEDIKKAFSVFGPIFNGADGIQVRDGRKGCYAFLTFENSSSAAAAIEQSVVIQGRHVDVELRNPKKKPASSLNINPKLPGASACEEDGSVDDASNGCLPTHSIFIARLPFGIQAEEIEKAFSVFGPILNGPDGIQVRDGRNGCYAFLTFVNSASAATAIAIGAVVQDRRVGVEPRYPNQHLVEQKDLLSSIETPPARRVRKALRLMPPTDAN